MKINLAKLKALAAAVANTEQGSSVWDKATDALNSKFNAQCLVTLIEQLEAVQRGRDTLLASQEHEDDCLINALASRDDWRLRAMKSEAELKRRDAQKPVAWISERNLKNLGKKFSVYVKHEPVMVRPVALYAAAPAAVNSPVIPDGWKLVPSAGLTQEMAEACKCVHAGLSVWKHNDIYLAALNSAPAPGGGDA